MMFWYATSHIHRSNLNHTHTYQQLREPHRPFQHFAHLHLCSQAFQCSAWLKHNRERGSSRVREATVHAFKQHVVGILSSKLSSKYPVKELMDQPPCTSLICIYMCISSLNIHSYSHLHLALLVLAFVLV